VKNSSRSLPAALLAILFGLSGCSSGSSSEVPVKSAAALEPVTVTFYPHTLCGAIPDAEFEARYSQPVKAKFPHIRGCKINCVNSETKLL
jgi:hypothetical protein